jgi:DNA-binding HxlR family transcriptional regulator
MVVAEELSMNEATGAMQLSAAEMEAMRGHAGEAASLLNALANESRLLVLCSLSTGEASLEQLMERVNLKRSVVFQQLTVLTGIGFVKTREHAGTKLYSVTPSKAMKIIESLKGLYCENLNHPEASRQADQIQSYSI